MMTSYMEDFEIIVNCQGAFSLLRREPEVYLPFLVLNRKITRPL